MAGLTGLTLTRSVVLVIRMRRVKHGANGQAEFTSVGGELGPQGSLRLAEFKHRMAGPFFGPKASEMGLGDSHILLG